METPTPPSFADPGNRKKNRIGLNLDTTRSQNSRSLACYVDSEVSIGVGQDGNLPIPIVDILPDRGFELRSEKVMAQPVN